MKPELDELEKTIDGMDRKRYFEPPEGGKFRQFFRYIGDILGGPARLERKLDRELRRLRNQASGPKDGP